MRAWMDGWMDGYRAVLFLSTIVVRILVKTYVHAHYNVRKTILA